MLLVACCLCKNVSDQHDMHIGNSLNQFCDQEFFHVVSGCAVLNTHGEILNGPEKKLGKSWFTV